MPEHRLRDIAKKTWHIGCSVIFALWLVSALIGLFIGWREVLSVIVAIGMLIGCSVPAHYTYRILRKRSENIADRLFHWGDRRFLSEDLLNADREKYFVRATIIARLSDATAVLLKGISIIVAIAIAVTVVILLLRILPTFELG